jgi:NAD(P)-dependent dehydrogenase (short-subunit alcohol dehydrogenase family)
LRDKSVTHLAVVQAALPALSPDGSITLIGGATANMARPATAGVAAANAAVHAAARVLAVDLAPRRVNVVAPGIIDTPWWGPDTRRAA